MALRRKATFQPYDMDTAIGTNNSGVLMFGYSLEDTDTVSSIISGGDSGGSDAPVFNAQDSVLWNNVRDAFRAEITQMYQQLRTSGAWSASELIHRAQEHQGQWCEAIYNEDEYYKHLIPLIDPVTVDEQTGQLIRTDRYLTMLQGSKEEQRKWWLYNRFRYMDSKYVTGDAVNAVISFRAFNSGVLTLKSAIDLYLSVRWGGGSTPVIQRTTAGTAVQFPYTAQTGVTEMETWIYNADLITDVGDMSVFYGNEFDFSRATRLSRLKIGDSDANYSNPNLRALDVRNSALLEYIDVRNCPNLAITVNLEGSPRLKEAYFDGTAITGVDLADGGSVERLHLPGTITTLTLINLAKLTEFVCPSFANVSRLMLTNIDQTIVNPFTVLSAIPANSQVNIQGLAWEAQDADAIEDFFDLLDTMQGVSRERSASGEWMYHDYDTAQVSGTIHTSSLTGAQIASYNQRYPYITVTADHVTSYLTYASYDGSTIYKTVTCLNGVPQEGAPSNPSRPSSAQYIYTFVGWSKSQNATTADANAATDVIADRTIYAAYTWNVRTYTVAWNNSNGTRLETDENVPWGTEPSYNGATPQNPSGSSPFTKWVPDIAKVTGNATYTASYTPVWKVYFYLDNSTLDATVDVLDGGTAVYPKDTPAHPTDPDSYEFTGWSPTPTNVRGNLSVYAQWKRTAAKWEDPGFDVTGAYAVQWHYGLEMPQLSRGGAAAAFSSPSPAEGTSGSGSSPFDNIAPWSGMEIYVDVNGTPQKYAAGMSLTTNDVLVKIPEFYYKAKKDTAKQMWTWAISPTAKTGYEKHPGSGRYVGRYHTGGSSSGVYSRSGVSPLVNTSQTNFRTYSANKGTGWHMMDMATWSAIQLLYLVEFADFDSQTVLGKGWNTGSIGTMGGTDSAAYHTVKATGAHNQYRWIEDPFSNCCDWIDGFVGSNSTDTYAAAKDSYAGGHEDLTALGFKLPSSGAIHGFGYSDAAPWAFIPDTASGSDYTTYVCDRVFSGSSLYPAYVGGGYNVYAVYGFFYMCASNSASITNSNLGSRLLKT